MEVPVIFGSNEGDGGDYAENVVLEGKPGCGSQATRIGQRPGVVLVPTFHVQETRPLLGRFG